MKFAKERQYKALADATFEAVFISDKGVCIDANRTATEMFGYGHEEFMGIFGTDVIAEESKELVRQNMMSGFDQPYEVVAQRKNGEKFHALIRGKMVDLGDRKVRITVVRDIDQQKKAERLLRESEEKYRLLVENQTDLVVKVDLEGRFLFVSPTYCEVFGFTEEELLGRKFMPLVHEEDRKATEEAMKDLFRPPYKAFVEQRAMTKEGWRWFAWMDTSVLDEEGEVVAIHGLGRDVTEQREAQKRMSEEKERLRILVEKSPYGVSLISPEGKYQYLNPKFIEIFGYDLTDIPTGKDWFERAFPDPGYRREVIDSWKKGKQSAGVGVARPETYATMTKDKVEKLINYRPVSLSDGAQILFYEDVTAQAQLEARLAHSARMEAVGTLAGGVAHDFNNLLQAIAGYAELVRESLSPHQESYNFAGKISQAAQSATALVKNLLAFSRRDQPDLKPVSVVSVIDSSLDILSRTIPKMISIKKLVDEDLWSVNGDFAQLEQVLINLGTNARDAMAEGGELVVEAENVTLSKAFCEKHVDLPTGDYVLIKVADTGGGIAEEEVARIFDPFFTTKGVGEGTGLGLSSAYGIVKNHGGNMFCSSEMAVGTTFSVYLPVFHLGAEEVQSEDRQIDKSKGGDETLLIVDDEDMIVELASTALESLGYKVLTASSGEEALSVYEQHGGEIAFVLLDLGMPGMGGLNCLKKLKQLSPSLKIGVATGYSLLQHADEVYRAGAKKIMNKPYNVKELVGMVRGCLDS